MSKSGSAALRGEVNEVDGSDRVVNKVDRLPAKVKAGAALRAAIGDDPLKKYGDKGLLANVTSGEKVPEYFARIIEDKHARRRLALALLEDDSDAIVTTNIRFRNRRRA